MGKGDAFWRNEQRKYDLKAAESAGRVADSMEVRQALVARFHAGEITLEQMKAELTAIQKGAKARGLVTRNQAFTGR